MQKARSSRRFACDRCRNYKLRCERVPSRGNDCCRCTQVGLLCTTTVSHAGSQHLRRLHDSSPGNFSTQQAAIDTATPKATECPVTPPMEQCHVGIAHPGDTSTALIERETTHSAHQRTNDLELSHFDFSADSLGLSPPSPRHWGETSTDYIDLDDCGLVEGPFALPSDEVILNEPLDPLKQLFELCASLTSDSEMLERQSHQAIPCASDQSWLEAIIQRTLTRTSALSEILEKLSITEADTSEENRVGGDPGRIPATMPPQCVFANAQTQQEQAALLNNSLYLTSLGFSVPAESPITEKRRNLRDIPTTTTLVTTYVLITRVWRYIFSHISKSLDSVPQGQVVKGLMLPDLQLGGIHVRNNPCIQLLVLIELSSSILRKVDIYLGIRAPHSNQSHYSGDEDVELALGMDLICVLLREAMLSQEKHRASSKGELDGLCLTEIMEEVRKQLTGRLGFNIAL